MHFESIYDGEDSASFVREGSSGTSILLSKDKDLSLDQVQSILLANRFLDIHQEDRDGRTCLFYAVVGNNIDVAKFLVKTHKFELNHVDNRGMSPLDYAIDFNLPDMTRALIELELETKNT